MFRLNLVSFCVVAGLASSAVAADAKVTVRAVAVAESRSKVLVDDEAKDDGRGRTQATSLRVTIELAGEPIPGATRYGMLQVKAVDNKGNALKRLENFFQQDEKTFVALDRTMMWLGRTDAPKDRIRIDVEFEATKREATAIASIDGSVKLRTGTPVDLLIAEPGKWVNKELTNRELVDAGLKVTISQFNPAGGVVGSYVKLKVSGKSEAMARVDVVDGNGKSLAQGTGVSPGFAGNPATYEVFGDGPLPAGTKVKITMLADVKEITVPIQLKDVPLP